jgi:hypothetical protein
MPPRELHLLHNLNSIEINAVGTLCQKAEGRAEELSVKVYLSCNKTVNIPLQAF